MVNCCGTAEFEQTKILRLQQILSTNLQSELTYMNNIEKSGTRSSGELMNVCEKSPNAFSVCLDIHLLSSFTEKKYPVNDLIFPVFLKHFLHITVKM